MIAAATASVTPHVFSPVFAPPHPPDAPFLSVVATSRNDDHGGNALRRMRIFVRGLLEQARRHDLSCELVLVEWNPPADRPRLAEVLDWPARFGPARVRIIEVPHELHRRFGHSDRLPLFQMIAKNVGIRRAVGRQILATNIDILFSDELVRFLAAGRAAEGRMYRIDRTDAAAEVPEGVPVAEQLEWCRRNVLRIHRRNGSFTPQRPAPVLRERVRELADAARAVRAGGGVRPRVLHTNGCGDFTLMHRRHWMDIRGYAEFAAYSFKIDGLLCYAGHYAGARETVLPEPMRIYHIEHSAGSGWTPGRGAELLESRLRAGGIPKIGGEQYGEWVTRMRRTGRPVVFNADDSWGLAGESLPETRIA